MNIQSGSHHDPVFAAALAHPVTSHQVVIGSPGSGKTTLLIERALRLVHEEGLHPDHVRMLTPTRAQATRRRDELGSRMGRATRGPLAKSVASFAFQILQADHAQAKLPAPTLRSGADMDEDIRALLEDEADDSHWPAWITPAIVRTEAFRTELRELMARVVEHGGTARDLADWAELHSRPEWASAATFMDSYQRVIARSRPHSFDAAEMITRATHLVARSPETSLGDLRVVLVDDVQDLPASARRLVVALGAAGIAVTAVGEPDVAGQTFRGSDPEGPVLLADALGVAPSYLGSVTRHGPDIRERVTRLVTRVGTARAGQQRQAPSRETSPSPVHSESAAVRAVVASSTGAEEGTIARLILDEHVDHGVPLDQIAVITRRAGAIDGIARALGHLGLPVHRSSTPSLSDHQAVVDLLGWVAVALHPDRLSPSRALSLLGGVYGNWSALDQRRLRAFLGAWSQGSVTESASPDDLLVALVSGRDIGLEAPAHLVKRIDRIRELVQAIRAVGDDAPVDVLLSTAWEAVGVEKRWLTLATSRHEGAAFGRSALDAVVALMETATRFATSHPQLSAEVFIERVLARDVAEDVIVPEPLSPAIWVGTPAAASGREWDVVVVHGLNEGVWPNTRLRGNLLGAPLIPLLAQGIDPTTLDHKRAVVDDEIRMATLAVSRARTRLVVSAVSSEDSSPSPLFHLVADGAPVVAEKSEGSDSRSLVGRLRRAVTQDPAKAFDSPEAHQLAFLAQHDVPGASPRDWWGLAEVTTRAALFEDGIVPLSPSKVGAVEESPLLWFLDTVAPEPLPASVDVGALIHRALEEHPWGPEADLRRTVEQNFGRLSFDSAWLHDSWQAEVSRQLSALQHYLDDRLGEGVELVASEQRFALDLPGARVTGVVDRVERLADGSLVVVDLKTGQHKTDNQVIDDPQLLAYQLALESEDVREQWGITEGEGAGAFLLFVKSGIRGKPYRLALQAPLTPEGRENFLERLEVARGLMARSEFVVGAGWGVPNGRPPRHRWHLVGQVCGD